jgi:hypothetical protein
VRLTLRPGTPTAATTVAVRATASGDLVELDPSDNLSGATLAPDVVLDRVAVLRHRDADRQVVARAQVTGVPRGTRTLRFRISGPGVGTGATQVHLTDGASGANGEGDVTCYTSDSSGTAVQTGVHATCTGMGNADVGSFYVDLRLAHQHGPARHVTVTVLPVGVDQDGRVGNDADVLDFS